MSHVKEWRLIDGRMEPFVDDGNGNLIQVAWAPQAGSQEAFLAAINVPELLYEGTRGPGKTDALLMDFFWGVGRGWGSEYQGLLLRRTFPELDFVIQRAKELFIRRLKSGATWNQTQHILSFPDNSRLRFASLYDDSGMASYLSLSASWVGVEELCTFPAEKDVVGLFSILRSTRPDMPVRMRYTTNPHGVGHSWVQSRFNLPTPPGVVLSDPIVTFNEKGQPNPVRRSVHGHLRENALLGPNYEANLRASARSPAEAEAWINGSWDLSGGSILSDIWGDARNWCLLDDDLLIPPDAKLSRSMDHGTGKPSSILYYMECSGDDLRFKSGKSRPVVKGSLVIIGEVYTQMKGQLNVGTHENANQLTRRMVQYELSRGWRSGDGRRSRFNNSCSVADTNVFFDGGVGASIADEMAKSVFINGVKHGGIAWQEANKGQGSRLSGLDALRRMIAACVPDQGALDRPALYVLPRYAPVWCETVPRLPYDKDGIDAETKGIDHAYDSTRYRITATDLGVPGFRNDRRGM